MDAELRDAYEHCRSVTREAGSSFTAAFWLLGAERRRALHAIYAFCRLADDIADDPAVAGDRFALLARWREELDSAYRGDAKHPVGIALGDAARRFALPREIFVDLLLGVESDLRAEEIKTFDDLHRYCYRVASTVGVLVVTLLGARDDRSLDYAVANGIAVQLTNVLRDVSADAMTGRIYLPSEDLARFGVHREDLVAPVPSESLRLLLAFYAERARLYYERAAALLPEQHRRRLSAARAMGRIYEQLLEELHRTGFANREHPGEPIALSKSRRVAIAASVWLGIERVA